MVRDRLLTELSKRLGIEQPIWLAPLGGGPSTPELVAAVANCGGFGFVAGAYLSPSNLEKEIAATKKLTSRPFGVNLFAPYEPVHVSERQLESASAATAGYRSELGLAPNALQPPYHERFEDQFAVVLDACPVAFSFTFGLIDKQLIQECRRRGILTIGSATTVNEGLALESLGVDAVIAQGVEAGGHRATFSPDDVDSLIGTFALTRGLSAALTIPVVATGGIMDGKGIAAALVLGAQAAQLGTAFMLCPESGVSDPFRRALQNKDNRETMLTRAFSGRWARGIENRFMREMADKSSEFLPFPAQNAFTRDIRKAATEQGRPEFLSLWAGQGLPLIREMSAASLYKSLVAETVEALG